MELANIEALLEKYLNAETTLQEENMLKNYFLSDHVAPHLEEYKPLFEYFTVNKNEKFTKSIQLKSQKKNWKWISVAASIVLIISVYAGYNQNENKKEAALVYQETEMALGMLSANLNKGSIAIAQLQQFEKTKNRVLKQPK